MKYECAALVIAAPASGQGKTTVTAALARYYRNQGKQVRIFKAGPDFLDPMILEHASGHVVYQLDLWMVGEENCRKLLAEAAATVDLILIEGVMGLFDGEPSTADLATTFEIPVLAVIDASAMAQTFAAIAYGLINFRQDLPVAGVFANRIGSERHYQMLQDALPSDIACYGALARQPDAVMASRHLGLKQAAEIDDLDKHLSTLAEQLIINAESKLPFVSFSATQYTDLKKSLNGITIAVAKDTAFSFIYQANLDLLEELGAELRFFSPLTDTGLPSADSLYLPGGYPELHLDILSNNKTMLAAIKQHYDAGKPILAECGGMLYLTESLTDKEGNHAEMLGLLSGYAVMQPHLSALALQEVSFNNNKIRGHTYHIQCLKHHLMPLLMQITPMQIILTKLFINQFV